MTERKLFIVTKKTSSTPSAQNWAVCTSLRATIIVICSHLMQEGMIDNSELAEAKFRLNEEMQIDVDGECYEITEVTANTVLDD